MLFSQVFLMLDELFKSKKFKTEDKDLNGKTKTTKKLKARCFTEP